MSNLFTKGMDFLNSKMPTVSITYTRGVHSATFDATLGSQILRVTDSSGKTKIERPDRDFMFDASLLVLNSVTVTPDEGDFVTMEDGSRFEVMPVSNGEPAWRYCDGNYKRIRVHTKKRSA